MHFIILSKRADGRDDAVVAPTGYYRTGERIIRDGTPSPEMGPIHQAWHFKTHRRAARTASALASPVISARRF